MKKEMKKQIITVAKSWNRLKTDEDRWRWLIKNPKKLCIGLDSSDTFVNYSENFFEFDDEYDFPELKKFDEHIGKAPGISVLLKCVKIESEGV